jgi:GNAT superfamily N-acetyltransferase
VNITISIATEADAAAIAAVRTAAAERLTREFGSGHWSLEATERGVLQGLRTSKVLIACRGSEVVGSLRLATKKPWAIDTAYFAVVRRPIYLLDMAVLPSAQRQGVGRQLCDEARAVAKAWPGQAIRLDAYDSPAGAGPFYVKCGFHEVGRAAYRGVPLIYFEALL